MRDTFGIILLDADEVIIKIYTITEQQKWKLIQYHDHDLATFNPKKMVTAADIVEIIAEASLSLSAIQVTDWKICARNISEIVLKDIATATGIMTEMLTLQREQDLLCRGILSEFL